jgi:hypothetical protein
MTALAALSLLALCIGHSRAATCATDGSDYSYTETIVGQIRKVTVSWCPNHPYQNLNPGLESQI